MSQMLDLDTPPRLERLLAQTHAGQETLRAELDRERAWLDDFACRAGLRPELVRRFVAVGLLAESPGEATAVPGALRVQTECVTIGLLLDVVHRLDALRDEASPAQAALWT